MSQLRRCSIGDVQQSFMHPDSDKNAGMIHTQCCGKITRSSSEFPFQIPALNGSAIVSVVLQNVSRYVLKCMSFSKIKCQTRLQIQNSRGHLSDHQANILRSGRLEGSIRLNKTLRDVRKVKCKIHTILLGKHLNLPSAPDIYEDKGGVFIRNFHTGSQDLQQMSCLCFLIESTKYY